MGFHQRVNIRGERIALPVDGPLQEAAWMKERIARAKQALPNGYCGLPLVQTCPHPNACLTLRELPRRRLVPGGARAAAGRDAAGCLPRHAAQGSVRLVEMLERDEHSLTRILDGLEQIDPDHAHGVASSTLAQAAWAFWVLGPEVEVIASGAPAR